MEPFKMTRYTGQIERLVAKKKAQMLEKQRKLGTRNTEFRKHNG